MTAIVLVLLPKFAPDRDRPKLDSCFFTRPTRAARAAAVETVEKYRCDLAITSIGAIDAAGCLLEYRDEEVVVARAMLRNARHKVLLADHTKFSRVATFKLGHLQDVTTLVTDRAPAGATATLLHEARCRMVLAERA